MLVRSLHAWLLSILIIAVSSTVTCAAETSGLPIPRFVSLKSSEVNVRTGPGTRYPIQFVYRREGMPVEITEEFDLWRKIRDIEGSTGWVHKTMLEGARNAVIKGKEAHIVRATPDSDARPVLKAEPMVVTRIIECEKTWCRIQLSGRKGWIEKKHLWGVYSEEVFD